MIDAVSAIIVDYKAGPLLSCCMDSLLGCSLGIEIIVIDNASQDGRLGTLAGLPQACTILNPSNVGFAAACAMPPV